jgi:hypothetical protein
MHPNQDTLEKFYTAFAALDPDRMAACYADRARFQDEVFTLLGKAEVTGMWRMFPDSTDTTTRPARPIHAAPPQ